MFSTKSSRLVTVEVTEWLFFIAAAAVAQQRSADSTLFCQVQSHVNRKKAKKCIFPHPNRFQKTHAHTAAAAPPLHELVGCVSMWRSVRRVIRYHGQARICTKSRLALFEEEAERQRILPRAPGQTFAVRCGTDTTLSATAFDTTPGMCTCFRSNYVLGAPRIRSKPVSFIVSRFVCAIALCVHSRGDFCLLALWSVCVGFFSSFQCWGSSKKHANSKMTSAGLHLVEKRAPIV